MATYSPAPMPPRHGDTDHNYALAYLMRRAEFGSAILNAIETGTVIELLSLIDEYRSWRAETEAP